MIDCSLADVVRFTAALGNYGIRGAGEHNDCRQVLFLEELCSFIGEQVVAGYVDVKGELPQVVSQDAGGIRRYEDGSCIDNSVDASKLERGLPERIRYAGAILKVESAACYGFGSGDLLYE